jgi:GT2 family glycosyltransferase
VLFAPRALPPLPPDVAEDPTAFSAWVSHREDERCRYVHRPARPGELRVLLPIVGEPPPQTVQTLLGLQRQLGARWTVTVLLHRDWHSTFTTLLAVSGLQRTSQRVRVITTEQPATLGALVQAGLEASVESDIALLFPGDVWAPDTVAQLHGALEPPDVVYADQDRVAGDGTHSDPRLKPTFSPDFLLATPYIGRPLAIGSSVVRKLAGMQAIDSAHMEHDLALRATEIARRVRHIPEVLCHRLGEVEDEEEDVYDARHVVEALERRGSFAEVAPGPVKGTYRVTRTPRADCKASIVICFRDEPVFLRSCIDSIDATRGTQSVEFVLIDNGSVQPETATLVDRLSTRYDVRTLQDDRPFNWAELNNAGARVASGEVLIFLNNDIEAHSPGWLEALCAQALRPEIGAVGARLLYPDRRLQHCGVVLGVGGAAGHLFVGLDEAKAGYLTMAVSTRECAAVTGACLGTRREVFDILEGFDEALGVDLNDVDYCLRGQLAGWRVLFDPAAELTHHESPSRGTAGDVRDIVHFIDRWRDSILAGDPFLNPHLTRVDSSCRLRGPNEKEWWQQWQSTLSRP